LFQINLGDLKYRAEEARERKSGGVGLGLAITERAVNAYDGRVWAENATDNSKLIVQIELPLT
jgi:two-component system, OmpR family, sensor histidine kinase CpxA